MTTESSSDKKRKMIQVTKPKVVTRGNHEVSVGIVKWEKYEGVTLNISRFFVKGRNYRKFKQGICIGSAFWKQVFGEGGMVEQTFNEYVTQKKEEDSN